MADNGNMSLVPVNATGVIPTDTSGQVQDGSNNDLYSKYAELPEAPHSFGILGKIANFLTGWYDDEVMEYNRKLAAYDAYQKDVYYEREKQDNWDMMTHQEQYESPLNQMDLYRAAGLNTNLIYGKSFGGSNGYAAPSHQAPTRAPFLESGTATISNLMGMLRGFQDIRMNTLRGDLLSSQIKALNQDIAGKELTNRLLGFKVDDAPSFFKYQADLRAHNQDMWPKQLQKMEYDLNAAKDLEEYRNTLAKYGLRPDDNEWAKLFAVVAENPHLFVSFKEGLTAILGGVFSGLFGLPGGIVNTITDTVTGPTILK